MAWNPWKGLLGIATGGISSFFTGDGGGKKKDPYQALLDQLNPLIQAQSKVTTEAGAQGLENVKAARSNYDFVGDFFKNVLEGSDDELLKMFDAGGLTKNINENEQQLAETGVRGGARSAVLGGAGFNRDAAISRALKQLRFAAPDHIAQIAQGIGQLGLGEFGAATGSSSAASQNLFGIEDLKQKDKDRKMALISSIFEAAGTGLGAFLGAK